MICFLSNSAMMFEFHKPVNFLLAENPDRSCHGRAARMPFVGSADSALFG